MAKKSVSPVRQQYLDIKKHHQNEILFFRLGDFYEAFDEDAETLSRELDIVLTSRNVSKGARVPMAGIPHHAAENYLSRLIDKGYHVAICEQVGTEPVNGLMPREVVRVVTPGTITEPGLLPGDANNYIAAIIVQDNTVGVAYADITTGEFAVTQLSSPDIINALRSELIRLHPAETVIPEDVIIENHLPGFQSQWPGYKFEISRTAEVLKQHFSVSTLDGFGLRDLPMAIRAAGGLLLYLKEKQPNSLQLLSGLQVYSLDEFMTLDANTRRNLELLETIRGGNVKGSLLGILDVAVTPMGGRMLRQWVSKPLLDVVGINKRLDGVSYFYEDGLLRAELRAALKPLGDLERLINRVVGGSAQPRDLVGIRDTLTVLPNVMGLLRGAKPISNVLKRVVDCSDELYLLQRAITDSPPATLANTGIFRDKYSEELDEILESSRFARDWIANLEQVERQRTGVNSLKVGYNKVHGYYIELTKANSTQAPEDYIRKQTLVNAERYITPEMKDYESLVLNAEEEIHAIELKLFKALCVELSKSAQKLIESARAVAVLDVLATLAEVAAIYGYSRPEVVPEDVMEIENSRHPVVEQLLRGGDRFVPNDVTFEKAERIRIITGPNMSGKSTYLRQVALIALLAQMGSYVPADRARIGLVDRIFTRIGAQDEIHAGQSTFMVEMVEVANILNHATSRSLLVLDEVGRGTSTYDGLSIAWAVIEYLHNEDSLRAKTLFATHYHELTQLSDLLAGVRNYNVAVSDEDGQVVFLHKIIPGGADRSYGIHVGQLAGLPKPVIQRAQAILAQLEASSGSATKIDPNTLQQISLFPESNPLIEELRKIDINELSPIDALNKIHELQKKFLDK